MKKNSPAASPLIAEHHGIISFNYGWYRCLLKVGGPPAARARDGACSAFDRPKERGLQLWTWVPDNQPHTPRTTPQPGQVHSGHDMLIPKHEHVHSYVHTHAHTHLTTYTHTILPPSSPNYHVQVQPSPTPMYTSNHSIAIPSHDKTCTTIWACTTSYSNRNLQLCHTHTPIPSTTPRTNHNAHAPTVTEGPWHIQSCST